MTLSLVLMVNALAAERLQERTLPIPGRGALVLYSSLAGSQQIGQPPEEIAPTIRFSNAAGEKFEVVITAFWSPAKDASFNLPKNVRSIVEDTLEELKPRLMEKKLSLLQLHGGSGTGYYIAGTVKAPGPGEYKFLTQGAIAVDDLLLTFTVLTNIKPSPVISQVFDMLRTARRGT